MKPEQRKAMFANMNSDKSSKRYNKLVEMLPDDGLRPQTPKPKSIKFSEQKITVGMGLTKEIPGLKLAANASIEISRSSGKQKKIGF